MTTPALPSFADLAAAAPVGGANPPVQQMPAAPGAAFNPPQVAAVPAQVATPPAVAPTPAPVAVNPNVAMIRRLEADGTLPANHGFSDDMQVLEYLANQAGSAAQPQPPQTAPQQPAATGMPAPSPAELAAAAASLQQSGLLAFRDGVYVAVSPLANSVAEAMNANIARRRAVEAELADPHQFIRNYGQTFVEEAVAPLQEEIATLRAQLAAVARQAIPDPGTTFVAENRAVLVGPTGALTPAGQAYQNAWAAAVQGGVTSREAAHNIALMAAKPLMSPVAPAAPAATPQPQQPAAPWLQTIPAGAAPANPAFTSPGSITANGPAALSVPTTNSGFPDFTALAAARPVAQQ